MQVLMVVNLMAFLLGALSLFVLVTPHDGRRAVNGKSVSKPRSDSPQRTPFVKR